MPALNKNSLLIESGNIFVGDDADSLVDLGALRNLEFRAENIKTSISSDNRGTLIDQVRMNGMISFEWLEAGSVSSLEQLFKGIVEKEISTADPVTVTDESLLLVKGDLVFIANSNSDGSKTTIDLLKLEDDTPLVEGTDFETVLINGKTAILLLDAYASETVTALATYTHTPAVSLKLTGGTTKTATPRYVKIVGPAANDPTKSRTIILEAATAESELLIQFVQTDNSSDAGVMPVTLKGQEESLWSYTDTHNVE